MKIDIAELVQGKSTYLNRNGRRYRLRIRHLSPSSIEVYYEITKGAARRIVSRTFPRFVPLNGRFIWVLGLLRGEGLRSVGSRSSMYRFNVVNNDSAVIRAVIEVLDESCLARFEEIKRKAGLIRIAYGPECVKEDAREHWAKELGLGLLRIELAGKAEPQKRALHGSCMLTISDVLLRRIVDLIAAQVYQNLFMNGRTNRT